MHVTCKTTPYQSTCTSTKLQICRCQCTGRGHKPADTTPSV
uniref:Uncharacterized protein n=1 Tax=Arundo donax TaxID=35708 RepID=A0A0A8Y8P1_ARUDO